MTLFAKTALIVLGAGLSTRFGRDKLSAELDGKPVATHLLAAVAPFRFAEKILVARGQRWTQAFGEAGFLVLVNDTPEAGMSASLTLSLCHALADNVLILLADMPYISDTHLMSVGRAFVSNDGQAVASRSGSYVGPPAMFTRSAITAHRLEGDSGGRHLLKEAIEIEAGGGELRDIDSPADIETITRRNSSRADCASLTSLPAAMPYET